MSPVDLLLAAFTGLAVVAVTLLADRLGGQIGGLLATAPVTTSAAHVVIATSVPIGAADTQVLLGVQALLAVTFGVPAFFYAVKWTRGRPSRHRLFVGLLAFLAVFAPLVVLFANFPVPTLSAFVLLFAMHGVLAASFMRERVPVVVDRPRGRRTPIELAGRFASGFIVVLIVRLAVDALPALAGALAVVPAVFLVSLTVLGLEHDAPFAARAAQAGLFGATAVAFFVLTIAGLLHLRVPGGIWTALPCGWAAYLGVLATLGRLHRRLQKEPAVARRLTADA